MKRSSDSFLFICERELPPTIGLVLVLARVVKVGGADRGGFLVDSVRPSLALWVVLADPGMLTSPSSVSSSSSDDGSGSVDSIK